MAEWVIAAKRTESAALPVTCWQRGGVCALAGTEV